MCVVRQNTSKCRYHSCIIVIFQIRIALRLSNSKVAMVGRKRKLASTVTDGEPANKLMKTKKKTGQRSRMASKGQKLLMFKRAKPVIPLDQIPLEVLEMLVNFLDVVS